MYKVCFAASVNVLVLISGQVFAQAADWSGYYAGGFVTHSSGEFYSEELEGSYNGTGSSGTIDIGVSGFGVFGGRNWQNDNYVYGVEASLGYGFSSESTEVGSDDTFAEIDDQVTGTFTGRLGYATGDMLVYGKAGLALRMADVGVVDEISVTIDSRDNELFVGGIVGLGMEYRVSSPWTVRAEAAYTKYRSVESSGAIYFNGVPTGGPDPVWEHELSDMFALTLGVSTQF